MAVLVPKVSPLANWDAMPAHHARIGYENLLVSASNDNAAKALTPYTYERMQIPPGGPGFSCKWQLPSLQKVSFIAFAAHNFGGQAGESDQLVTIKYATTVGGALTNLMSVRFNSTRPRMEFFSARDMIEIEFSCIVDYACELGVFYAGRELAMYQPIYGGHNPIDLNSKVDYQSVMSDSGQFIGRNIIRRGGETTFNWRHLDPDWYRQRFQPFAESAKTRPFFIKWRPDLYDTIAFCHTTDDLKPSNMGGGHRLMSVSMPVRSHEDL